MGSLVEAAITGGSEPDMDGPRQSRLLDVVRERMRTRYMSYRAEKSYIGWSRHFIHFHGECHPR